MQSLIPSSCVEDILVDARALQDADYRFRGVGQHSASLLSALRRYAWPGRRPRLVALIDHKAEALHSDHVRLFDDVVTIPHSRRRGHTWLLSLSPMTHDPVWLNSLLLDPTIFKVALCYDLIPLETPYRYLRDLGTRADYVVCFAWLGRFDAFAAISEDTRRKLVGARAVDGAKTFVTGVAVRPSLEPLPEDTYLLRAERTHILVSGGGDPRKNPECALRAHAASATARSAGVPVKVFGNYSPGFRSGLRSLYAEAGGRPGDLVFLPHLSDDDLRDAYRTAVLTIVPSRAEGFSIPIVESAAAGTPVLVSDVGAHPELVADPDLRFPPDQPEILRGAMDRLIADEESWRIARDHVAAVWPTYTEEMVGARFVEALLRLDVARPAAPAISRQARPRIAVLTPLPPAGSGVADYSAVTIKALSRYASLDIFTDSLGAIAEPHFDTLGSIQDAGLSTRRFDATISVLGNSDHHFSIFNFLLDHGGAALAHDARMLGFYRLVLGEERALTIGRRETGDSTLDAQRITHWLHHEQDLPVLFMSEIAACASPLLLHSAVTAREMKRLYGVDAKVLPFAQYHSFPVGGSEKASARRRIEVADDTLLICSFGLVAPNKAPDAMLWAIALLNSWGVRTTLALCGAIDSSFKDVLLQLITKLEINDQVILFDGAISHQSYMDYLKAADAGLQLRTYGMGSLSGALNDCVAAALPTVANDQLATAMLAPSFVRRVPDDLSPVLIAEALLEIFAGGQPLCRPWTEAALYAESHSPDVYARRLMEALEFDIAQP